MDKIEVRAFGKLFFLFRERKWQNPFMYQPESPLTAEELREKLEIPACDVEVVFIDRLVKPINTLLAGGERIAFVPPGVPSIHRFNLGFYDAKKDSLENS